MQKIPTLFKRNHETDRQVRDEVNPECHWVIDGEGAARLKVDGTCVLMRGNIMYKRVSCGVNKTAKRRKRKNPDYVFTESDLKDPEPGWFPAQVAFDPVTGNWPGWLPVGLGPEDKYHREAQVEGQGYRDGTYELVGPKVQGNPHRLSHHFLIEHDTALLPHYLPSEPERTFDALKDLLAGGYIEGIVWHHPDGRMAKIKARDFGHRWPREEVRIG